MQFTNGSSPEKAEVRNEVFDEAGQAQSPPSIDRADWDDLRKHGEFPQSALTAVEPGTIEVPAGKFDVTIYRVETPGGTMKFYFAKNFAGPPVLVYRLLPHGVVLTSTLIERRSPAGQGNAQSPERSLPAAPSDAGAG
jgi:hypothetical protein